jgi:hypothetical protein
LAGDLVLSRQSTTGYLIATIGLSGGISCNGLLSLLTEPQPYPTGFQATLRLGPVESLFVSLSPDSNTITAIYNLNPACIQKAIRSGSNRSNINHAMQWLLIAVVIQLLFICH